LGYDEGNRPRTKNGYEGGEILPKRRILLYERRERRRLTKARQNFFTTLQVLALLLTFSPVSKSQQQNLFWETGECVCSVSFFLPSLRSSHIIGKKTTEREG